MPRSYKLVCLSIVAIVLTVWAVFLDDLRILSPSKTLLLSKDQLSEKPLFLNMAKLSDGCVHLEDTLFSKPFVYLLQTEACMPDHLKSLDAIGNATACQCDVIVLSYKTMCSDTSLPHVKYIFNSSTQWTTGRNLLHKTVLLSEKNYFYYIFMDDDVVMKLIGGGSENPWRVFEKSLLKIQPLVAATDWGLPLHVANWRKKSGCLLNDTSEFVSIFWFDAMFNAYHYKALPHLLPYNEEFDKASIWNSQLYNIYKADILYRGQVLLNMQVLALNPLHRPYPRKLVSADVMKAVKRDLRPVIQQEYRNISEKLFKNWPEVPRDDRPEEYIAHDMCTLPVACSPTAPYNWLTV